MQNPKKLRLRRAIELLFKFNHGKSNANMLKKLGQKFYIFAREVNRPQRVKIWSRWKFETIWIWTDVIKETLLCTRARQAEQEEARFFFGIFRGIKAC